MHSLQLHIDTDMYVLNASQSKTGDGITVYGKSVMQYHLKTAVLRLINEHIVHALYASVYL